MKTMSIDEKLRLLVLGDNRISVHTASEPCFPMRNVALRKVGPNRYVLRPGEGNVFHLSFEAVHCDVFVRILDADDLEIVAAKVEMIGGYKREYLVWTRADEISVWFKRTRSRPGEPRSGVLVYSVN